MPTKKNSSATDELPLKVMDWEESSPIIPVSKTPSLPIEDREVFYTWRSGYHQLKKHLPKDCDFERRSLPIKELKTIVS